ncbi:hypothetical protein BGX26_007309 [Mortierella sp. AD094]|nr:hypothetical protein BGX26_007309 [Mortierella sp. AD094]
MLIILRLDLSDLLFQRKHCFPLPLVGVVEPADFVDLEILVVMEELSQRYSAAQVVVADSYYTCPGVMMPDEVPQGWDSAAQVVVADSYYTCPGVVMPDEVPQGWDSAQALAEDSRHAHCLIDLEEVDIWVTDMETVDLETVDLETVDLVTVDLETVDLETVDLEKFDIEKIVAGTLDVDTAKADTV